MEEKIVLSRDLRRFHQRAVILASFLILVTAGYSQKADKEEKSAGGLPVLWEKVNIRQRTLYFGTGWQGWRARRGPCRVCKGRKRRAFETRIKDASGRIWMAKIGDEAQSETASVRLLAAIGYETEINYLVPLITIPSKGTFENVRLEARPDSVDRGKQWNWGRSPFENTPQMKGLMLMMAFINNWDMKSSNNVILKTNGENQYVISDLGVSFGKTGSNGWPLFWRLGRSRNKPADYAAAKFVTGTEKNRVKVVFNGKNRSRMRDFTTFDARWLADLLEQLSEQQIKDAFRAANYAPSDVDLLTRAVRTRIAQLDRAGMDVRLAGTK